MLRKTLFILATVVMASFTNAQTTVTGVVGNVDVVKETPVLKALADKVNAAHVELTNAASGSRTSAQQAQLNFDSAINAYLTELNHQLSLGKSKNEAALKSEIELVKQIQAGTLKAPTR